MSNLQETPAWIDGIYQLTEETPVLGKQADIPGDGPANIQAQQLANRTQFLRQAVDGIQSGDIPYTSPEAAQQAINSGKLPANSKFSVRVGSEDVWVAEYQNFNNVATPTGKVYPTKSFIDNSIKAINFSVQDVSEYLNQPTVVHSEVIKTGHWTNSNTSGWAVGVKSTGTILNYLEMWIDNAKNIDHVNVRVYSRSVDGPTVFPGAETDELLSETAVNMADIALTDSIALGYQLVRFRVPPALVVAGRIAMFVIQPYDADNNPVYMSSGNAAINSDEVAGLSGALGGFWKDIAQTQWRVTTATSGLNRIAYKIGFFSTAADDKQAFVAEKSSVFELPANSADYYKVGATPQTNWYGFAVGFPGKTGFDVITLQHQNLSAVSVINYRVFLRQNSASGANTALGLNSADVQVFSGSIVPPDDSLDSDFTSVDYPVPGLIIPDGYFAAIEVHAHAADGSYAYFGVHGHDYAGVTPPAGVAIGFYASVSSVVWAVITSYVGIAWTLSRASWQNVTSQVRKINDLTDSLGMQAESQSALISEMNSYPVGSSAANPSDSSRWTYASMPETERFYQWAASVQGSVSVLKSAAMWLDGLSLNDHLTCRVYFRQSSLSSSAEGPGAAGDILALTEDVTELPATNNQTLVELPFSNLAIPSGYFPIISVTAYYSDGAFGNMGSGSRSNTPPTQDVGWYGRVDRATWQRPNGGSVAWSVETVTNQTLQQKISDLEGTDYPEFDLLFPPTLYNVANDIDYKVVRQTYTGPRLALKRNFSAVLHLDNFIPYTDKEPLLRFDNGNISKIIPAYSPVITAGAIENPNLNGGQNIYEETVSYSVSGNQAAEQSRALVNRSVLNSASKDKTPVILIIGDSVSFGQDAYFADSSAKWNYTMILNRMFAGDKQQNDGAGYDFRTVGTISYTDIDGQKTYNEAYSGTTLQGTGLFNNPKFLDSSGAFSFANWLLKYRTCNANGQRLYFDANKSTTGTAGANNKGYLEDGSDSGLLIGSTISNTLSVDVYEPTHVFCFHCSNAAISKTDYDLFISRVRATFPAAIIGLGTPHIAGTYFPSHYPDVYRPAIWDYDQTYNNRQVTTARVLLANFCNAATENNNVFVLPTMWVTPAAHAFSCITINEPWRDIVDGDDLLMPVGQRVDVHVGSKAQAAYAQQIYAWLKWTAVKGLF